MTCLLLLVPACAATQHDAAEPMANEPVVSEHQVPPAYEAPITETTSVENTSIDPIVARRMNMRMTTREATYTEVEPFVPPTLAAACGWEKPTFYFNTDDADVGLVGEVKMNALGTCLSSEALASEPVVIVGYADERGDSYDNLELGLDRANAVKSELVAQGVDPDRIDTYSRGEYAADDDDVFFDDRRVVVKLDR